MFNWSSITRPLAIVIALFWAGSFATVVSLAIDKWLQVVVKSNWKTLLSVVVIVLAWRIPVDGPFFHGLEYEDSYVYTVAGRQLYEHVGPPGITPQSPYSIQVCEIGSLKSCRLWEPVQEHLIGYPYIIAVFSRIAGYTPAIGSLVNLLAACFGSVMIFSIVFLATDNATMATAASIVFSVTPVFAVYGLETSAEPASNICITLVIWFYMRLSQMMGTLSNRWTLFAHWCAYTSALLFSLTVKRENMILAILLPLLAPFVAHLRPALRSGQFRRLAPFLLSTVLALLLSVKMHLLQTTANEAMLLRAFPLTATRLGAMALGFVRSFFVIDWYGGVVVAVLLGTIISWRRKGLYLVPLCLFSAYVLLYALHIRSYYEMRSGHVELAAALRFSMNLMSLWAILAGVGIGAAITTLITYRTWKFRKRTIVSVKWATLTVLLGISFVMTDALRSDAVEDETNVRVTPARVALDFASRNGASGSDFVVSLEPLVMQMYGDPSAQVVDLGAVDSTMLRSLLFSRGTDHLLLVEEVNRQTQADFERYGEQTQYLQSLPRKVLWSTRDFKIIRVERP